MAFYRAGPRLLLRTGPYTFLMAKLRYFLRALTDQLASARSLCPNCGSSANRIVDRKYLITQLRRCANCELLFRTPTDDPAANADFYENEYSQGFTSDLPSDAALDELKTSNFAGTEKDCSYYIGILRGLGLAPNAKLFDFGCSWGYGSYQFARAGFDVTAFEVGTTRRRFAESKLGVRAVPDMDSAASDLAGQFDCFFSSHVLEHIPAPADAFRYAMRLLAPGGLFVSFTPNGSEAHRAASPAWSKLWGEVHPNFLDDVFFDHNFQHSPRCVGSSRVTAAPMGDAATLQRLNDLSGDELFFAARKIGEAW